MVYSINGKVVFGQAFSVPAGETPPVILDIFGDSVDIASALEESNSNKNRDGAIVDEHSRIIRNMEIGYTLIALWREFVIRSGVTNQGAEQLSSFSIIVLAFISGCLYEAGNELIPAIAEGTSITAEIKDKFIAACLSADHMAYEP